MIKYHNSSHPFFYLLKLNFSAHYFTLLFEAFNSLFFSIKKLKYPKDFIAFTFIVFKFEFEVS